MKRCAFVVLLAVTFLLPMVIAQGPPAATPSPPDTPAILEEERALSRAEAETLRTEMEKVLREAEKAQSAAIQDEASRILGLMEDFLGFLAVALTIVGVIVTLIFGVLTFLGFREWRDVRGKAKDVQEKAKEIQEAAQKTQDARSKAEDAANTAEKDVQFISGWRTSLDSAWKAINEYFRELPILESEEVDGVATPPVPIEISATFEDRDVVLVVCDHLNIPADKTESAEYFLKLARYWRITKNYPRAHARVERALALAPDMPEALRHLARTLTHWAETLPEDSPERLERLKRALKALEDTRQLQKEEDEGLLFDEAYTRDIMGDFEGAAALYQKARAANRQNSAGKQEERWYLTYNLACSLSLAGRLAEAFEEIDFFLEKWPERWKFVEKDPHLARIRLTSPWKDKLQGLIEKAKEQSGG